MDADGSNKRELNLNLDRSITRVTWSSNGKGLYVQYSNEGVTNIAYTDLKEELNE